MKTLAMLLSMITMGVSVGAQTEGAAAAVPGVVRVGGDREVMATFDAAKQEWRSGSSRIDTPLPEGYPAPTPPGAIEIKSYPVVRRAEIATSGDNGFMPLFRHIQREGIAMTSPVENDYVTSGTETLRQGAMSFLYRTADMNETGVDPKDARIKIRDTAPLTVLSLGGRGSYASSRVAKDVATLREWLAENTEWQATGEPRALMYNGPTLTPWKKWLEVQIPVTKREVE